MQERLRVLADFAFLRVVQAVFRDDAVDSVQWTKAEDLQDAALTTVFPGFAIDNAGQSVL